MIKTRKALATAVEAQGWTLETRPYKRDYRSGGTQYIAVSPTGDQAYLAMVQCHFPRDWQGMLDRFNTRIWN